MLTINQVALTGEKKLNGNNFIMLSSCQDTWKTDFMSGLFFFLEKGLSQSPTFPGWYTDLTYFSHSLNFILHLLWQTTCYWTWFKKKNPIWVCLLNKLNASIGILITVIAGLNSVSCFLITILFRCFFPSFSPSISISLLDDSFLAASYGTVI